VNWSLTLPVRPADLRRWKSVRDLHRGARRQRWEGEFQDAATTVKFAQRRLPVGLHHLGGHGFADTVNIDSSGVLQSTFTVTATTTNLDIAATGTATLQTRPAPPA